jgi:hypothetical protein
MLKERPEWNFPWNFPGKPGMFPGKPEEVGKKQ